MFGAAWCSVVALGNQRKQTYEVSSDDINSLDEEVDITSAKIIYYDENNWQVKVPSLATLRCLALPSYVALPCVAVMPCLRW